MSKILLIISTCFIAFTKSEFLIDLTHPFDNKTNYWRTNEPFTFTNEIAEITDEGYWYAANQFCMSEHVGTHLDAPYHFNENGLKVGEIPTDRLYAKGIVIDLSRITKKMGASTQLLPEHLIEWQIRNGPIEYGTIILVRFGWSKYWANKTEYFGIIDGDESQYNFPGLSEKAAQWIANSKKIYGVGVDTASIDPGNSQNFVAHRTLYKKQLYGLENVMIPVTLPAKGFSLVVAPMKISEGTGAPVRIFAIKRCLKIF